MTIKELKCADLIDDNMKSREEHIREMMENPDHDDYFDDPALSISIRKVTTICFSYGGPADYLEITWQGNGQEFEIDKVEYLYQDWFDGARRVVLEDSPLYEYARNVIEWNYIND